MKNSIINKNKTAIRSYIRTLRHSIKFAEQYIAAQLITNKIITLNFIKTATRIGIFISCDGEIRTDLLIKTLLLNHKCIYLPIISSTHCQYLSFAPYTLSTPLILKKYLHIYEPSYNIKSVISIEELDVVFVPLVAFDDHKNRLGRGKGFYDKTLQFYNNNTHRVAIGLGYDFQKIPTIFFPVDPWDIKLSNIITPNQLY